MNPVKHDDLFGENFRTLHDPNNQDMAVRAYFKRAFRYAVSPPHLITRDDVNSRLKSFAAMTSRRREEAQSSTCWA